MKYLMILTGFFIYLSGYSQNVKITLEKSLRLEVTSEIQVNTISEIAGTSIENSSHRNKSQLVEVTNKQNDVFYITISVKRLVAKLQSKNDEMFFDSEKKDNPVIMVETYDTEAKSRHVAKVNSKGYLITEDTLSSNSVLMINPMTSNHQAGSIPVLHTAILNKNLKQDDKLTDSVSGIIEGMKSDISGVYTVNETLDDRMIIGFNGNQKISGFMKQAGQEISTNGNCKVNAEMTIDMRTGLIINLYAVYEGTLHMDAGGMLIPVTIKTVNQHVVKML